MIVENLICFERKPFGATKKEKCQTFQQSGNYIEISVTKVKEEMKFNRRNQTIFVSNILSATQELKVWLWNTTGYNLLGAAQLKLYELKSTQLSHKESSSVILLSSDPS